MRKGLGFTDNWTLIFAAIFATILLLYLAFNFLQQEGLLNGAFPV